MVGKHCIESMCRMPVEVELASEFRYRDPMMDATSTLVIAISQSGETADTLAAIQRRQAAGRQEPGHRQRGRLEPSPGRRTAVFYTHAGPEIGVASTKAFTTQLVALYLLALLSGPDPGRLAGPRSASALSRLVQICPPGSADPGRTRRSGNGRRPYERPEFPVSRARASITPSRWKGPSSSRKSPTFTPRAMRPAK